MFNLASGRNFTAIVFSFLGLLLTVVDDLFEGNGRVSRMSQLLPLTCGTETWSAAKCFNRFAETRDGTFH